MLNDPYLQYHTLINFNASTLTGAYQKINGTGTAREANSFKMYNSGTSLILLSTDGTNNHDFIPPGGSFVWDAQSNSTSSEGLTGHKKLRANTEWWAKTTSNTDRLVISAWN